MSSQTPNINLTLPTGPENVSRQIINDNNTKIDTAIGTLNDDLNGITKSADYVVSNIAGVKAKLLDILGTMVNGESRMVRIVHTNNSETDIMRPSARYEGLLCNNYLGSISWLASDMYGNVVIFSYEKSTQQWAIDRLALNNKITTNNNTCANEDAIKAYLLGVANTLSEGQTKLVMFRPAGEGFGIFAGARYSGFLTFQTLANGTDKYFTGIVSSSRSDVISFGYFTGTWNFDALSKGAKIYLTDVISGVSIVNNDTYQIGKLIVSNVRFTTTANIPANQNLFKLPKPINSGGLATSSAIAKAILEEASDRTSYNATVLGSGNVYGANTISSGKTLIFHACYIAE